MSGRQLFASILPHRARAALRTPVGGYAVLLAVPAVISVARGGRDLQVTAGFALLASGSACAFVLDDLSRDALSACPRGWTLRHLSGAVIVAGALAGTWAVIAGLVIVYDARVGSLRDLLPATAASAAMAVAFAGAGRVSASRVGLASAIAALLALYVVSGLSMWTPIAWLPTLGMPAHARRWWTIAATGALAAAWFLRDPAARRPVRSILARPHRRSTA